MLSPLEISLVAAALVAGLTGAWSPCGLSMVETIGPTGHEGGRRTTAAACLTFTAGALVGGVVIFGSLSLLGAWLGGGHVALAAAAGVAALAAVGEARAVRIVPQIRRQVPETWRRTMPLPVAAGLYGVLLGLGFTTFVLTLAVWVLAGFSVALGNPVIGALVGVAFGLGRALPVAVMAPLAGAPTGLRLTELMAERPGILRGFRTVDALALSACAVAVAV